MTLRRRLAAALAAASLLTFAASAAVAGPWALAPGEYYTELSGSFYSVSTAYDANGDRIAYPALNEQRTLNSYTELGWKKHWSVQLSLPVVSRTYRESDVGAVASNTGLGDFGFGMRWQLANGRRATAVQLQWTAPAGYNTDLFPAVGDGHQALAASLQLGSAAGTHAFWQASGGYRYDYRTIGSRSTDAAADGPAAVDWADHFTTDGAVGLWFGDLLVAGQWMAEMPMSSGRPLETKTVLAGPRITYRVDDRIDAFAGSWHSPMGENVLHLDQYYAGVTWKATKLNRLQGFLGGAKRP
ncbi:MAG: hypothetical protein U0704_00615 [Candidatus Eisenbacteria bacterium]